MGEIAGEERPGYDVKIGQRLRVGIGGPVGGRAVSPRELGSGELRRLICVEGVAVKVREIFFVVCWMDYCYDDVGVKKL